MTFSDIDECASDNGGCGQVCMNKPGSFECACNDGYVLSDDKKTCEGNEYTWIKDMLIFYYYPTMADSHHQFSSMLNWGFF